MRRRPVSYTIGCSVLLLFLFVSFANLPVMVHAGSSDLTVDSIWLEDASQPGQPISQVSPGQSFLIVATIKNIGQEAASSYYLDVYYDSDYGRGGPDNILAGEAQTWYVGSLTAQDGTHTTKWVVDPDNLIAELDEGNNQKEYTFTIGQQTTTTTTTTTVETSTTTSSQTVPPTLTLTPTSGGPGTLATASGLNYQGTTCLLTGEPSSLFNSQTCSIAAGVLTGSFTVDSGAPAGLYSVSVQTNAGQSDSATSSFTVIPSYTVTFYTDPSSATVTVEGASKTDGTTGTYLSGARVHVIANPPSGYSFASWETSGVTIDNQLSQDTYMIVSTNGWLKAHFTGPPRTVTPTSVMVWRPADQAWSIRQQDGSSWTQQWGTSGDVQLLADFDQDGTKDLVIWRPSIGKWFILKSSTGYAGSVSYYWGKNGDVPLVGDFDGDGKPDLVVWRPSIGKWFILKSSTGYAGSISYYWGTNSDKPLIADFDGDGKPDLVIWRPSSGKWSILKSSSGYSSSVSYYWGKNGDVPLLGDFDGDGKPDLVIWRPSSGKWAILKSTSNYASSISYSWGTNGDTPLLGDFDGDRKPDLVVWRPSGGKWYILKSSTGYKGSLSYSWGKNGDIPLVGSCADRYCRILGS